MSSLASKISLAQFDALLLWAKIANVIGHRTVPATEWFRNLRIPPFSSWNASLKKPEFS